MATTTKAKKSTKPQPQMVVQMAKDKETKGAVRYAEDAENFGKNIYFRKEELQEVFSDWPESITVTIEAS